MSGWDKPGHSEESDDGRRDEQRGENWDRPFPGAPRDRQPAPEIDWSKLRSFEEIAAERRGPEALREYQEKLAARRQRLEKAELTSPDKPPGAPGEQDAIVHSEGAQDGETTESADQPDTTDRNAERVKELESELAETEDELAEAKVQLTETKVDLAEAKADLAEERFDRRQLTRVVADQADEIKRLRAQLEAKGDPVEGSSVRDRQRRGEDQDESLAEKKPERSRLPSTEAVAAASAGGGILEAVATHGHLLTTWEGVMTTATAGFGVALYGWAKKKHDAHEERRAAKDADRPEN